MKGVTNLVRTAASGGGAKANEHSCVFIELSACINTNSHVTPFQKEDEDISSRCNLVGRMQGLSNKC